MKQLTLNIPEDVFEQLVAAAGAAGQTAEQFTTDAMHHRLLLPAAPPVSLSFQSVDLATLQITGRDDQYLDW